MGEDKLLKQPIKSLNFEDEWFSQDSDAILPRQYQYVSRYKNILKSMLMEKFVQCLEMVSKLLQ